MTSDRLTTEQRASDAMQTVDAEDLIAMIACTKRGTWLARVIANELASRGLDHNGEWVGHERARRIWVDAS